MSNTPVYVSYNITNCTKCGKQQNVNSLVLRLDGDSSGPICYDCLKKELGLSSLVSVLLFESDWNDIVGERKSIEDAINGLVSYLGFEFPYTVKSNKEDGEPYDEELLFNLNSVFGDVYVTFFFLPTNEPNIMYFTEVRVDGENQSKLFHRHNYILGKARD